MLGSVLLASAAYVMPWPCLSVCLSQKWCKTETLLLQTT